MTKHCPKIKMCKMPESTLGVLTEFEREAICAEIMKGWVCGYVASDKRFNKIHFNLVTHRSQEI